MFVQQNLRKSKTLRYPPVKDISSPFFKSFFIGRVLLGWRFNILWPRCLHTSFPLVWVNKEETKSILTSHRNFVQTNKRTITIPQSNQPIFFSIFTLSNPSSFYEYFCTHRYWNHKKNHQYLNTIWCYSRV